MKLNKINIDKPIIVVGDVHGYYNTVVSFIKNNNISNFILLFAGDTGCGFSSKNSLQVQLQKLDKICVKNNINVLMLRGNHDDPSYFNTDEPFEFGNIKCIPDYTLINNEVLCIGGATSIDRCILSFPTEEMRNIFYENFKDLIEECKEFLNY